MKQIIAENAHYIIEVDKEKNLMYLKIIGAWSEHDQVSHYPQDIKSACLALRRNFILITDLRKMALQEEEVETLHLQAQTLVNAHGLYKTIEVENSAFVKFQAFKIAKNSDMPVISVQSHDDALELVEELRKEANEYTATTNTTA